MKKLLFLCSFLLVFLFNATSFAAVTDEWTYFFSTNQDNIRVDCYCDLSNVVQAEDGVISAWTANVYEKLDQYGVKTSLVRYAFNPKKNLVRTTGVIDLDAKDQVLGKDTSVSEWMKLPPKTPAAEILRVLQEKLAKDKVKK